MFPLPSGSDEHEALKRIRGRYLKGASDFDPSLQFVSIDSARIRPDDRHWLIDGGSSDVKGSIKLVGCNLITVTLDKIYYLDSIIASDGGIDDVPSSASGEVVYLGDTAGVLVI